MKGLRRRMANASPSASGGRRMETAIAPVFVVAWLAMFVSGVLVLTAVGLAYASFRLKRSMQVLQEGLLKP